MRLACGLFYLFVFVLFRKVVILANVRAVVFTWHSVNMHICVKVFMLCINVRPFIHGKCLFNSSLCLEENFILRGIWLKSSSARDRLFAMISPFVWSRTSW